MNTDTPPVFSITVNTPLITNKKMLIITMVRASSAKNTLTGAVITRQNAMPRTSPPT